MEARTNLLILTDAREYFSAELHLGYLRHISKEKNVKKQLTLVHWAMTVLEVHCTSDACNRLDYSLKETQTSYYSIKEGSDCLPTWPRSAITK